MKNFLWIYVLISSLGFAQSTFSQSTKPHTTVKKIKEKSTRQDSYFQFGPRYVIWQESIPATRPGQNEKLDAQFQGLSFAAIYRKSTASIRWVQSHSLDASVGALVAKSVGSSITDRLRNQMWYALTLSPGITYRTTSISEVGLSAPLSYRGIQWSVNDPTLKLDRESSFSYGVSGSYTNHLSQQSSLQISFTNHFEWSAFIWSVGWNYRFL